ncbi:MAG: hypothetical protein M1838_003577 [Thelocarpon superellum]|nr:MAG: hypothetical protein M1838_003577 [Thelocarpon superellum]
MALPAHKAEYAAGPRTQSDALTIGSKPSALTATSSPETSLTSSPISPVSTLQYGFNAGAWTGANGGGYSQMFSSGNLVQWPAPETFHHPHVLAILEKDDGLDTVSQAYDTAISALDNVLTPEEMKQVRAGASITDVIALAQQAQPASRRNTDRKGKTEHFVDVLTTYGTCLDVLSQSYAQYTCLVWGSFRFVLQVSQNYYAFFEKIKVTLCEIADDLPRILMYQQLLSTKRMQKIVAELYAHIVRFLQEAIVFYRRKRFMKYVAALWSPFEVSQKTVAEAIHRLRRSAEAEANAVNVARHAWQNAALFWEVGKLSAKLGEMHDQRLFRDFKDHRSGSILEILKDQLFAHDPSDATFHDEMIRLYETTQTTEWDQWFYEERRHVTWTHQPKSTLTYMQTNLMEPQLYCKWIAHGRKAAGRAVFAHVVWAPRMDANSAVASIVFQILQQQPDVLLHPTAGFAHKLRAATSFEMLWAVLIELLNIIPGLFCYISIPSVGPEEVRVVEQLTVLVDNWTGPPINMQLVTPLEASFPKPKGSIDIDDAYDVDSALDTTDALHQVVLAELQIHKDLTERMSHALWQSLWRTVCYHIDEIVCDQAKEILIIQVNKTLADYTAVLGDDAGAAFLHRWAEKALAWCRGRETERFLRSIMPDDLPFLIPPAIRQRLQREYHETVALYTPRASPVVEADSWDPTSRPRRKSAFRSMEVEFREETWTGMKDLLSATARSSLDEPLGEFVRRALEKSIWDSDEAANDPSREKDNESDADDAFDVHDFLKTTVLSRSELRVITQQMSDAMTETVVDSLKFGLWRTTVAVKGFADDLRGGFASGLE